MPSLGRPILIISSLLFAVACVSLFAIFFTRGASAQSGGEPVIVALGDSLTFGIGATEGNTYVDVLSRWSGISIINEGDSGDRTNDALNRLDEDVLSRNPDIVIVFLGGNDILQLVSIEDTIENLELIITQIKASGADVILVGTHDTTFQRTREARFRELARDTGVAYVSDALDGILGRPALLADPVHPNDAGYRIVAERIWERLREVLNERYPSAPLSLACEGAPTSLHTDQQATWTVYDWGSANEPPRFRWESAGGTIHGSGRTARITYKEEGTYTARVIAERDGNSIASAECRNSVQVTAPPLAGHCEVEASIQGARGTSSENTVSVRWRAEAKGASGSYTYAWSGTEGLSGTSSAIQAIYTSPGTKEGRVRVSSGSDAVDLLCTVTVTDDVAQATSTRSLVTGCTISPPSGYGYEGTTRWQSVVRGGSTRDRSYEWSLPGSASSTALIQNPRVTYESPGLKTGRVTVSAGSEVTSASCQIVLLEGPLNGRGSGPSTGGGGTGGDSNCFIATAAYGSPLEPEVEALRTFRDEHLLTNAPGRVFVRTYYATSPPVADFIREHDSARAAVRVILTPIVSAVQFVDQE